MRGKCTRYFLEITESMQLLNSSIRARWPRWQIEVMNIGKTIFIFALIIFSGCTPIDISIPPSMEDRHEEKDSVKPFIPAHYIIGPSDVLEIMHYIDPDLEKYIIDRGDKLQIELYYYPELNRAVTVRPDGFITLAKIGEVKAKGEFPRTLAKKISELYSKEFARPIVTVTVNEINLKLDILASPVTSSHRVQTKNTVVRPDGRISLPYIQKELIAAGKTLAELNEKIQKVYRENINNISITVSVAEAKSYQACILGDVNLAGCYALSGPTTLLQIISRAGGFTKEANTKQLVVMNRNESGKTIHSLVNIENIIKEGNKDIFIKQYDIVYVPRTWLADTSFITSSIWQLMPHDFIPNFSIHYSINE